MAAVGWKRYSRITLQEALADSNPIRKRSCSTTESEQSILVTVPTLHGLFKTCSSTFQPINWISEFRYKYPNVNTGTVLFWLKKHLFLQGKTKTFKQGCAFAVVNLPQGVKSNRGWKRKWRFSSKYQVQFTLFALQNHLQD